MSVKRDDTTRGRSVHAVLGHCCNEDVAQAQRIYSAARTPRANCHLEAKKHSRMHRTPVNPLQASTFR